VRIAVGFPILTIWLQALIGSALASAAPPNDVTEYEAPTPGSGPLGIAAGPDGNVWFTAKNTAKVVKVTPTGQMSEYTVPGDSPDPEGITRGGDGAMWFALGSGAIGRITTSGTVKTFPLPSPGTGPESVVATADGALWFTDYTASRIGRMEPNGSVTEFDTLTHGAQPYGIAAGPDGNIWFTSNTTDQIGRITPDGAMTEFQLPGGAKPYGIAAGPDGNIWFTQDSLRGIGVLSPAGDLREYRTPTPASGPRGIVTGPDKAVWFVEQQLDKVARLDPRTGSLVELPVPTAKAKLANIAVAGPRGHERLWFTETDMNRVGWIDPSVARLTTSVPLTLVRAPSRLPAQTATAPSPSGTPRVARRGHWMFDPIAVALLACVAGAVVAVVAGRLGSGPVSSLQHRWPPTWISIVSVVVLFGMACAAMFISWRGPPTTNGKAGIASSPSRIGSALDLFRRRSGTATQPAEPMHEDRTYETATLLDPSSCKARTKPEGYPCGAVLVTGGFSLQDYATNHINASAELFDPATGHWRQAAPMLLSRSGHTATLLDDGRVLVAGGQDGKTFAGSATAELYDPARNSWVPTKTPMTTGRYMHTATPLPDGRVLVAGGTISKNDRSSLSSSEIFDPASGTWTPTTPLNNARQGHAAALLPDGRVLVAGGLAGRDQGAMLASAEVFDPVSGAWALTGSLGVPRGYFTMTTLEGPDCTATSPLGYCGEVLVTGGFLRGQLEEAWQTGETTASAELYNPRFGSFASTASMANAREGHTATVLPDGNVVVVGGDDVGDMEIYRPARQDWQPAGLLRVVRYDHATTTLTTRSCKGPSGPTRCLLIVGGSPVGGHSEGTYVSEPDAELYPL
jgi:streptogramin lyase